MRAVPVLCLSLVGAFANVGCRRPDRDATPSPNTTTHAAEVPRPESQHGAGYAAERSHDKERGHDKERSHDTGGKIETVEVPGDRAVLVVMGRGEKAKQPIVHLHGMCSEAKPDLAAWASAVHGYGTIIALDGDAACKQGQGGGRTWSLDIAAIDQRVTAAIDAVGAARGIQFDPEVIVIGESMGSSRAAALAQQAPEKYTRLVLIGPPEKLSATDRTKAVAVLAAEKEPQENAKKTVDSLQSAGRQTRMWTLSAALHGEYGPNGAATMSEALAFVAQ